MVIEDSTNGILAAHRAKFSVPLTEVRILKIRIIHWQIQWFLIMKILNWIKFQNIFK
jgi:hypothetical protein